MASFASSILSSKDHATLVIGALQLVELLLCKLATEYKPVFRREGIFHEIDTLASRSLVSPKSKEKEKEKEALEIPPPADPALSGYIPASLVSSMPGLKRLSQLAIDPDDAITLRARLIRFKHSTDLVQGETDDVFANLRRLVDRLADKGALEKELISALHDLASLFASSHSSVSSFELLQSGMVDGLLQFVTDKDYTGKWLSTRELLLLMHGRSER